MNVATIKRSGGLVEGNEVEIREANVALKSPDPAEL